MKSSPLLVSFEPLPTASIHPENPIRRSVQSLLGVLHRAGEGSLLKWLAHQLMLHCQVLGTF